MCIDSAFKLRLKYTLVQLRMDIVLDHGSQQQSISNLFVSLPPLTELRNAQCLLTCREEAIRQRCQTM